MHVHRIGYPANIWFKNQYFCTKLSIFYQQVLSKRKKKLFKCVHLREKIILERRSKIEKER